MDPNSAGAGKVVARRTVIIAGVGAVGLLTATPIAFLTAFLRSDDGRFLAGTVIDGVDIENLTPAEALASLQGPWVDYLSSPVVFELNGRVWRPRAGDIGLEIDFRSSMREAWLWGRSGGLLDRVSHRLRPPVKPLSSRIELDRNRLWDYLRGIAAAFDQPATEADIELGPSGPVRVRPSQIGRVVDVESGMAEVQIASGPGGRTQMVKLAFRDDTPSFTTEEAEAAVEHLQQIVSGAVWLMHGQRGWTITPQRLREALAVDKRGGVFVPRLEFTRFNDIFQTIDSTLTAEPKMAIFEYDEQRDRVTRFEPGHPGQRVDRPALEQAIFARATDSLNRHAQIPLILTNKEFDLASNPLGVKDLLATGSSLYRSSPGYRRHNIELGASRLDGQVIHPGEEFSFIERIGSLTLAEGWVEGSIIIKDKTEQGVGGGICQISTTLFRAALRAGLPIEQRWPHLYRVRYYEMGGFPIGIDATVFVPGLDLKFVNDFGSPILIRTRIDPRLTTLDFQLWGSDDGRIVELQDHRLWSWKDPPPDEGVVEADEEPDFEEQLEWAKKGVQASITRLIRYADGENNQNTFRSSYTPWPNRFAVGLDVAKGKFPHAYNKWFDENPEQVARWGVSRVPGIDTDRNTPSG